MVNATTKSETVVTLEMDEETARAVQFLCGLGTVDMTPGALTRLSAVTGHGTPSDAAGDVWYALKGVLEQGDE